MYFFSHSHGGYRSDSLSCSIGGSGSVRFSCWIDFIGWALTWLLGQVDLAQCNYRETGKPASEKRVRSSFIIITVLTIT